MKQVAPGWSAPARFGAVGVLNTVAGFGIILAGRQFLGLSEVSANGLGYGCGVVLSFALNRGWTFSHRGSLYSAVPRYLAVLGLAWTFNIAILVSLLHVGLVPPVAHAFGLLPYSATVYLGCRHWAMCAHDAGEKRACPSNRSDDLPDSHAST